jgi:hypothetical protein
MRLGVAAAASGSHPGGPRFLSPTQAKAARQAELQTAKAHANRALARAAALGHRAPMGLRSPTAHPSAPLGPATAHSLQGFATPQPPSAPVGALASRGRQRLTPTTATAPTLSSTLRGSAPARFVQSPTPTRRPLNAATASGRPPPTALPPGRQTPGLHVPWAATPGAATSSGARPTSPKSPVVVGLKRWQHLSPPLCFPLTLIPLVTHPCDQAECERRTATMLNMLRASDDDLSPPGDLPMAYGGGDR